MMMRSNPTFPIRANSVTALLLLVLLSTGASARAAEPPNKGGLYAKNNLVAWCIVPFDAGKRGPAQRAAMLKKLGIAKLAYDWRNEHVPTFEEEIKCLKRQNIDFFAFWSPMSRSPGYTSMIGLIEKHRIHPQLWMITPAAEADSNERRVEVNAKAALSYAADAKRLGCAFALYNHGGWSGEPDNLIAMVKWLREHTDYNHIGIVYNFHHGHEHLKHFPAAFKRMVPFLTCVNLNGMTVGGPKILALGQGKEDLRVLKMIRDSGYRGPIGILDHRGTLDAEESLQENLTGLKKLLTEMGDLEAAETYAP